jgi:predicted metalloprotease
MKWKGRRTSKNVEDRRGAPKIAKMGGGIILLVIVISLFTGQNPLEILQLLGGTQSNTSRPAASPGQRSAQTDELAQFVAVVLADTEAVWGDLFGGNYPEPVLVIFEDSVRSACGLSSAATGPFYCPGDQKLYLDLGFFRELEKLGAPGDFALAYVIGHEVGHHVQTVTGISDKIRQAQRAASGKAEANQWQVRMELQADCYAGIWAHHAQRRFQVLEAGDVEEGLRAAAAIGDDSLQQRAGRKVRPESFTHGSSADRVSWFSKGLNGGKVKDCNTLG